MKRPRAIRVPGRGSLNPDTRVHIEPPEAPSVSEAIPPSEGEARLAKLAAQLPGFIYQFQLHADGSTSFPYASQGIRDVYGTDPAEVIRDARKILDVVHPDDLERLVRSIQSSAERLSRWHEAYRVRFPDGRTLWVEGTATPERLGDGSTLWHGYIQDVTERKRAEAAVRIRDAALEAAATAILITDREGIIEWTNPAFTELTGYGLDEALGRTPWDLMRSGVHGDEFYEDLWTTVRAGKPWVGELVNHRKDGTSYPEALSINPVRDIDGKVSHFVAFKRDLTEERAQQARLLQSQKMESVGRLAGGIAHDFNNILTVICGTTELALGSIAAGHPLRGDLEDVHDAAQRASALTRQLLAFSRQQVLKPETFGINGVVTDLSKMLTRLIGGDVVLVLDLAEDAPVVKADVHQLEQVIVNLVVNARDAMPLGGKLTLATRALSVTGATRDGPPPGDYARLTVRDTGTGIPADVRPRIFDPFFTTKEVGKGTGLGLATAYGIVRQSGGTIAVETEEGRGTAFHVFLPLVGAHGTPDTPVIGGPAGHAPRPKTVLLVDDENTLRKVTARMLERVGYHVLPASGGKEAIELAEQHAGTIDLLLSDIVMPGMTGPELLDALRRQDPDLRALFTSGYPGEAVPEFGVQSGSVPFIPKPYSLADLTEEVRRILES